MRVSSAFFFTIALLAASTTANAQAYLDEPNSLSTTFVYTYAPSGKIVAESGGLEVPSQGVFVHLFTPSLQYVTPVRGLAVEGEVPLMLISIGDDTFDHFPMNGEFDDGDRHLTLTDIRAGVRYQVTAIERQLGLAFSAGALIPTDYPTLGLTAPGQGLFGGYGGVSIARTVDPIWENLFFQADYTFTLRQKVDDDADTKAIGRNYSNGSFFLGVFLPKDLTLRVGASGRLSHGGIEFKTILFEPRSVQNAHDRLLKENFIHAGGDLSYSINSSTSVGGAIRLFAWGENTRNQNLFAAYVSYKMF